METASSLRDPHASDRCTQVQPAAGVLCSDHRRPMITLLKQLGLEQQIAISHRLSGASHQAFVLGRARTDFDDDDLTVARYVLIGLDRQMSIMQQLSGSQGVLVDLGLTARETSVLALPAAGYPNRVIARRLGCAPRTVQKHLERVFRKLGVRDKLNAVRVARAHDLVSERPHTGTPQRA